MIITLSVIRRFLSKVERRTDGCWYWSGSHSTPKGGPRPTLRVNGNVEYAYRVSYAIYKGDIEPGMLVMHLCHNQLCVNPDHLEAGTQSENMAAWSGQRYAHYNVDELP